MPGALFSRLKTWVATEDVTYSDLNAEFNNILQNLLPAMVDDYSTNVSQMQVMTDPGEVGTESLATTLAGEIARLRFSLKSVTGKDYWYESPDTTLADLVNAVGTGLATNRISSGKVSANSSQLVALDPDGTAATIVLDGTPTNFVYYINGVVYTVTTDITITGLSTAPAINNTALINDTLLADNQFTQHLGEYGTTITIDAAGTEITNKVGQYAAFSINNGADTEYFIAYINSATQLTKAWRGCFFNSSQATVKRIKFSDNDTITLLRLTWIFGNTSSGLAVTYSTPTYAATQPSAPSTGDYWFDLTASTWKTYNSTTWVAANATLIGVSAQTSTACVAARTFDSSAAFSSFSSIELEYVSSTVVRARNHFASVAVGSSTIRFGLQLPTWDIAANLDSGVVEAASTFYYLYVKESGAPVISDIAPSDMRGSRYGLYHPAEMWRCIGRIKNNASSNFDESTVQGFGNIALSGDIGQEASMETPFSLNTSVGSNNLTITLMDRFGDVPSQLAPVKFSFRNTTATTGQKYTRSLYKPLTIVVPNAATLGHTSNVGQYVWVAVIDDNGTLDLGVSGVSPFAESSIATPTQVSSGATSGYVLYSSSSIAGNRSFHLCGRLTSTQTTAGTWATAISEVSLNAVPRINRTQPISYTPTFTGFGSPTGIVVLSHREGRHLIIDAAVQSGTPTAVGASFTIGFAGTNTPANITIDTGLYGSLSRPVGVYGTTINGGGGLTVYQNSGTTIGFGQYYTSAAQALQATNGNVIAVITSTLSFTAKVAIAGWHEYGP